MCNAGDIEIYKYIENSCQLYIRLGWLAPARQLYIQKRLGTRQNRLLRIPRIPGNEERQPVVHSIRGRDRARARDRDRLGLGLGIGLGLGSRLPLLFSHFRVCVSGNA